MPWSSGLKVCAGKCYIVCNRDPRQGRNRDRCLRELPVKDLGFAAPASAYPRPSLAKTQNFPWQGLSDTPAMSPLAYHCAATSPVETTVFTCLANRFQCPHGCTLIETIPHAVRAKFDRQRLRVSAGSAHLNLSMPHGALAPSPVSLRESRFHCAARCAPCKVILAALRSTAGAP